MKLSRKQIVISFVIIVVLAAIGAGGFYALNTYIYNEKQGDGVENLNKNYNTTNLNSSDRPSVTTSTDEETGLTTYLYSESFDISFPSNWFFTTPKTDHPDYKTFLLIASNQDADSILSLDNSETGIVSYLFYERYDGSLSDYLNEDGVSPKNISDERVSVSELTIGDNTFTERIVDSTNIPDWEGSYAAEYLTKKDSWIIRLVFTTSNKAAMDTNSEMVDQILSSIKYPETVNVNTSDWQTYTNEEFGYSLQYPPEATINSYDNLTFIISADATYATVEAESIAPDNFGPAIEVLHTDLSADEFNELYNSDDDAVSQIVEPITTLMFAGKQVKKVVAQTAIGTDRTYYFFEDLQKPIVLSFAAWSEIHQDILSTFDFFVDTSDWQTYHNTKFNFTMKFPKQWGNSSEMDGSFIALDAEYSMSDSYLPISDFGDEENDIGKLVINIDDTANQKSLSELVDSQFSEYKETKGFSQSNIDLASGIKGIKVVVPGAQTYVGVSINRFNFYFINDEKTYYIGFAEDSNVLETVVNTFKTYADWESYSNNEWKFSFDYPPFLGALVDETEEPSLFDGKVITRIYTPGQNPYLEINIIDDSIPNVKKWIEDFAKNEPAKTVDWSNVQIEGVSAEKGTYSYNFDNTHFYNQYVFNRLDKTWVVGTFNSIGEEDTAIQNLHFE